MYIQNVHPWLESRRGPLVNGIVKNALFQSNPHINQTLHQIIHILHFSPVDSLLNYVPDFVATWIDVRAVRWPQINKFSDHDLLDYCTFRVEAASNDAQIVWVNTECGKDHSQKNLPKLVLWYRNVYNQIA